MIGPVLQQEAESLNQTTQEELSLANQTLLLEEVAATVKALSAVNLTAAHTAANQESRWVSESHMTFFLSDWPLTGASLSPPSLAQSLLRTVHTHFLSEQQTTDQLRPLVASMAANKQMLGQLLAQLDAAAQLNNRTHTLLDDVNTLLHTFQVTTHAHKQTHNTTTAKPLTMMFYASVTATQCERRRLGCER